MGFFGDMGLIGKTYKYLQTIEALLDEMEYNTFSRKANANSIRQNLYSLMEISMKNNRTINYADFEFKHRKYKLNDIIYLVDTYLKSLGY